MWSRLFLPLVVLTLLVSAGLSHERRPRLRALSPDASGLILQADTGNLIVNGGFEEPSIAPGAFQVVSSIPGWMTVSGSPNFEIQNRAAGAPFEGNQHVELDAFAPSAIFQDVPTQPGRAYELSFAFSARPGRPLIDNVLRVSWGGEEVATLAEDGTGLANTFWKVHRFQVLGGPAAATQLVFEDLGVSNGLGTYIDDVRLVDLDSITGVVLLDGASPMAGVSVQLAGASAATTTTDGAGAYSFSGLATGTYTVTPSLAGFAFTPATRTFATITGNQTGDFTGEKVWAITGTVRDLNDTGVPNITVNVTGSAVGTTTTNADGQYGFLDLPEGGTYTVTPSQLSFAFMPESQTFGSLTSDQVAGFFLAEVGTFTRYFAEGATSSFFDTEIALLNATGEPTTATLAFLKGDGTTVMHDVALDGLARATVLPKQLPGLDNAEFSTVITSTQPLIADRTMRWDHRGYGSHAETSIAAPALEWYLAEGATIGGFNLFYLIQNPNPVVAQVEVTYLLPAPQAPIVRTYPIVPNSRFNIWVNLEDPVLAAAEVSAVLRSTNDVPVIVERAMYRDRQGRTFDAGHESAGVTAPATEWFLAEGATGVYFDLFILIANPETTTAQVEVDYLLPAGTVLTRGYSVAPQSRFNIWVDFEDPRLADTAVSARVRATNDVPLIVERAMWWPGDAGTWHEGHNSAGAVRTSTKWGLADGQVGGPFNVETYILITNTSPTPGSAQVTLVFEDGTTAVRDFPLEASSRENVPLSVAFPEAASRRFGVVVEGFGSPAPELVVERAMYGDAEGVTWAAGTNVVGTRLR